MSKTTTSSSALFLQYYSESRFLTPHYQSVRPKPGQNHLVDTLHQWLIDEDGEKKPKKEEEDDFIMQLNELPDPPCTPVRNLRSSFFLPSSSPPPSSVSPSPSSSLSMSSASSSTSASSPPSSPSLSNSSSSSEFMHLLEREVRGLG